MKTKKMTLLLIALLVISCSEELTPDDINPDAELTAVISDKGNSGGTSLDTRCDPDYEFAIIANGTPGYRSVQVHYDSTLTAEQVICARYDFFQTYPGLFMGALQASNIHLDNWQITNKPMFPHTWPNRLKVHGKVEVETAICIDPRTERDECED